MKCVQSLIPANSNHFSSNLCPRRKSTGKEDPVPITAWIMMAPSIKELRKLQLLTKRGSKDPSLYRRTRSRLPRDQNPSLSKPNCNELNFYAFLSNIHLLYFKIQVLNFFSDIIHFQFQFLKKIPFIPILHLDLKTIHQLPI